MSKRRTPQLDDDPFCSAATPCQCEKPMPQCSLGILNSPFFFFWPIKERFEFGRGKKIDRVEANCGYDEFLDKMIER